MHSIIKESGEELLTMLKAAHGCFMYPIPENENIRTDGDDVTLTNTVTVEIEYDENNTAVLLLIVDGDVITENVTPPFSADGLPNPISEVSNDMIRFINGVSGYYSNDKAFTLEEVTNHSMIYTTEIQIGQTGENIEDDTIEKQFDTTN